MSQVDILALYAAPQALHEYVIDPAAHTVHYDVDAMVL
jgi:hypothetical protein